MKATEGKIGRVFILSLEEDDKLPHCIEKFAGENDIKNGYVNFIAGIKTGSIISGPKDSNARPVEPLNVDINNTHESAAIGLIARDNEDNPILHIHGFLGRNGETTSGCFGQGVDVWVTGEAIVYEILDAACSREIDEDTGFKLLQVGSKKQIEVSNATEQAKSNNTLSIDTSDGFSHIIHLFNSSIN